MLEIELWGNIVVKRPGKLLHGCFRSMMSCSGSIAPINGHWQDRDAQKSVVFSPLDKTFLLMMDSILLLSFTFRFSACRSRELSERSNSRPLWHQNTKTCILPRLRADCEHTLPHRLVGTTCFTFFRHAEAWPSQVWFVSWLFYIPGQAPFYRRFKSRATLDE